MVNSEADIDTSVLHVKAIDKDTGVFGTIKYSIFDEENNKLANDNMVTIRHRRQFFFLIDIN